MTADCHQSVVHLDNLNDPNCNFDCYCCAVHLDLFISVINNKV